MWSWRKHRRLRCTLKTGTPFCCWICFSFTKFRSSLRFVLLKNNCFMHNTHLSSLKYFSADTTLHLQANFQAGCFSCHADSSSTHWFMWVSLSKLCVIYRLSKWRLPSSLRTHQTPYTFSVYFLFFVSFSSFTCSCSVDTYPVCTRWNLLFTSSVLFLVTTLQLVKWAKRGDTADLEKDDWRKGAHCFVLTD